MSVKAAKRAVNLGLLEEDDIFEEFPTKGNHWIFSKIGDLTDFLPLKFYLWIENLMDFFTFSEAVEKTDEGDVNIWEDNWDDDAVEDDFSVQLRWENIT